MPDSHQAVDAPVERYASLAAYNTAHPGAELPANVHSIEQMRGFDAAGTGIEDDLIAPGALLSIEFLPGGAPGSDELDRLGTVVATQWGKAPVYVLADAVSLRAAWRALFESWPTSLSAAVSALSAVRRYPGATH